MVVNNTKVVQVTNIAPQATKDQMQTLFGYLGKIEDIRLYPTIRDVSCPVQSRICYVKFVDSSTVGIAQHMTNTVFIDRALIVIPVQGGEIPDEYYALEMTRNGTIVPGFNVNEPKLPPHVTNNVQGTGSEALIQTTDPQLEANDLPPYPPLPVGYDSVKIEETRRTILMRNIDTNAISIEDFIQYFNTNAGEVKYVRLCECPTDNTQHLLIEFTDQPTIIKALKLNGDELKGKKLEITHSTQSIIKPQAKSNEAAQKEIEEAMSRFKEAQNMISASIEPVIGMLTKDKRSSRRSRSRSPRDRERDRDRDRDRDRERRRSRRSRSRSKSRRRSRSRRRRSSSRTRKSRSRDRDRRNKRSKSRSRKRSRSRSSRRSISRRSRSTTRRSRSKSASKRRSSRHRSKSRGRSHERKSRERSRDRKRDRKSSKDKESSSSSLRKSKEKSRESKDKKTDKESSIEESTTRKRSRSRSRSHHRRSRSKDRKKDKDRRRSRSRERRNRRSPSPRSSRKRSRSRSRDRKKEKKERKEKRDRSRSRSKVPRNYDEEEKGFDTEKEKNDKEPDSINEKDSSEKSDNMDISNSP